MAKKDRKDKILNPYELAKREERIKKENAYVKQYRTRKNLMRSKIGRAFLGVNKYRNITQKQSAGFINALGMGNTSQQISNSKGKSRYAGRPDGPSGKYVIPGVGPVGVYEFRRWLRNQQRMQLIQAKQQQMQNMQKYQQYNQQQLAAQTPMENRVIPNTTGFIPLGGIQKEIDDACNEVP